MHSRKCNEVLIDDIGDIAESSGEESEEIGSSSLTNNLQADEAGGNILLSNTFLAETVSSQLSSDNQASAGTSVLTPTANASSQLSSDNQTADRGFLKCSEASLLQMCQERSEETNLSSKTAQS